MQIPSDSGRSARSRPRRISCSALALAALLLPGSLALPARAQQRQAAGRPDRVSPERSQLRRTIEQLYEVLPVRGGLLLKPRVSKVGVRTIELREGTIAVNGETVAPSVLRAWLGDDAPAVLELAGLPAAERRQLFGLSTAEAGSAAEAPPASAGSAAPPGRPAPPPSPSPSSASDDEPAATETPDAPEPPEAPTPPSPPTVSSGPRVRVGGSVRIEPNEVAGDVIAIGGSVHDDGEVTGDISAIGGPAWVNGKVGGGVSAVGGSVHLGPKAEVMGDITCVLGHIDADPAAKVHGAKTEVSPGEIMAGRHRDVDIEFLPFHRTFNFFGRVVSLVLLGLLACILLLLGRPVVERLEARVAAEPWKAGLVGFLSQIFFLPLLLVVTVVLVISIVGCALILLYPFLFVALAIAGLLGFTAVALRIGRLLEGRFERDFGNPYLAVLLGVIAIEGLSLIGRLMDLASFLGILAALVLAVGGIFQYCAWTVGFGAFVLDRWERGFRRQPPYAPPYPVVPPAEPILPPPATPTEPPVIPPREPWEPGP